MCNFVAIAQGELPQESWFALGRLLTTAGGEPVLLSWSGSMFEYLMPLLVMPTYENTLLDQTYEAAVERQIEYGRQRGVPWGISESGYNTVDVHLNYQYRAFGVPGLGLKRGLGEDLVVAPYASALALMVAPEAACLNLQRLAAGGLAGRFGLFEAIDYTPSRQRRGESSAVVRSFMAHHQGMSLLSFAYVLLARPMQKRFESDPLFQATLLLLQERIPQTHAVLIRRQPSFPTRSATGGGPALPVRVLTHPDTAIPEVQLLSNGRYHVMVTNAGGGSSRWKDLAVTRWREDSTSDNWGTFCYLRDETTGEFWSTAHQPTLKQADHYEAIFSEGRAEFRRRDFDFETHTEIVVSPEDDIEVRRVRITNRSRSPRPIDVTSYAEVVLAPAAADALHPAFSNLFVQTEIIRGRHAILCTRRPRSLEEHAPWMFHLMTVHGANTPEISFETDRMRFIGRGHSVAAPLAMTDPGALSGTEGPVLDPIAAIRQRMTIDAGVTVTIDMVSGAAETRDAALLLVDKYQDRRLADRVFELTWTHSQVVLRQLNATEADSQLYARLASSVIYANASLRAAASVLVKNRRGQSGLWGYAISGDLPIVLLQIADSANIELVRQLVQAHAYWRLKGLAVDLVIWNEDHDGYRQRLQEQIIGLIAAGIEAHVVDRPGGIFVRHAEQISNEDRVLFQSVARAIITDNRGTLADQINRRARVRGANSIAGADPCPSRPTFHGRSNRARDALILFNRHRRILAGRTRIRHRARGGRGDAGSVGECSREPSLWDGRVGKRARLYVERERPAVSPHSMAQRSGGRVERGSLCTFATKKPGTSGRPRPLPAQAPHLTSRDTDSATASSSTSEDGIRSELTIFVAIDAAVKFSLLKVTQPFRPRAPAIRHGLRGMGIGRSASEIGDARDDRNRCQDGRLVRAQSLQQRIPGLRRLFSTSTNRLEQSAETAPNSSDAMARCAIRPPCTGRASPARSGAALDPCGAIQVAFDLADGRAARDRFPARRSAATPMRPRCWHSVSGDPAPHVRRSRRGPAAGGTHLAPCRSKRQTRRSTC